MNNNIFLSQNLETVDRSLISVLKHPNVFQQLPLEIKNLINKYEKQYNLNLTQFANPQSHPQIYFESNNVTDSLNSSPFVD